MPYFKSFDTALQGNFADNESVDMSSEMALKNSIEKFVDLTFFTLYLKFNPTIKQVLNRSCHFIAGRNRFDRKAETNSLYASFV